MAKTVDEHKQHTFMMTGDSLRDFDRALACFDITRRRFEEVEWLLGYLIVQLMNVSDVVSADADDVSAGFREA